MNGARKNGRAALAAVALVIAWSAAAVGARGQNAGQNADGPDVVAAAAAKADAKPMGDFSNAVLIRFEGPITPMSTAFLYRGLDKAKSREADLVVIEFNSPGGYLRESLDIAHRLRDLKWARTVAFVPKNEEALSGAAIASLGADDILMAKNAVFGDAGPIFQDEGGMFRHASEKIRSDLARRVRDLAKTAGRPPALAEAMVDMELVVFKVHNKATDELTYMSQSEIDSSDKPADWVKIQPVHESREKKFLEVNGERAVELGLADNLADDRKAVIARYRLKDSPYVIEPGGVDTAIYILNLPLVTGLLFVIGLIALYVEFSAPGVSIGGLLAGLCFALFFWSRWLGGTAGWLEAILILAGVIFLAVEIFVIPGFGLAGITGVLLLLAGVVLASQTFVLPSTGGDWTRMTTSLSVMAGSFLIFIAAAFSITKVYGRIPILSSLALEPPKAEEIGVSAKDAQEKKDADAETTAVAVGDWGVADSPLRPAGKAVFHDEYFDVVTDGTFVDKGTQVRVIKISGNRIMVREIT